MKLLRQRKKRGFTLLEMLVAIAIGALIVGAIAAVFSQTLTVSTSSSNREEAVKRVENAMHWIDRDGQMASRDLIAQTPPIPNFLVLTWTTFDNDTHVVTYSISNSVLKRSEKINGGAAKTTTIADSIDSTGCSYLFDGKTLIVNLKASVSGFRSATETRTLYVIPRVSTQ
jgi:prepilin-type N-terminal cleavage/methylation domain-containing protein